MSWPPPPSARWTAIALFLLALGLHLFVALGGTVAGLDFKLLIILDEIAAILLAPLIVALLLRVDLRDAFFLRSSHWSHYVVAGAAAIPLQLWGGSVQELVIESMPGSDRWREMLEQALEPLLATDSLLELAALMLGAVVLAAICEELLFRGMLLRLLSLGGRWGPAIMVTAFAFSLFHLDIIGLLPRTVMGIYFGLLVWRSGSILPAMLAHGINNLLAFTAVPFLDGGQEPPTRAEALVLFAVSGVVLAAVVGIWWRLSPATPPRSPAPPLPPGSPAGAPGPTAGPEAGGGGQVPGISSTGGDPA